MAEKIAVENGRISNFEGLVTLTFTLDRVKLHTIVHHSSTSTNKPNFIEIEETVPGVYKWPRLLFSRVRFRSLLMTWSCSVLLRMTLIVQCYRRIYCYNVYVSGLKCGRCPLTRLNVQFCILAATIKLLITSWIITGWMLSVKKRIWE